MDDSGAIPGVAEIERFITTDEWQRQRRGSPTCSPGKQSR